MYPANEPGVVDLGHRHYAWPLNGGGYVMWWHDCRAVAHVSWNWLGQAPGGARTGHRIVSIYPLHVEGSLVCLDCRDHGFIRNGQWEPV